MKPSAPEPERSSAVHLLPAVLTLLLGVLGIWLALRGGLAPADHPSLANMTPTDRSLVTTARYASVVQLLVLHLLQLLPLALAAAGYGVLARLTLQPARWSAALQLACGLGVLLWLAWVMFWLIGVNRALAWGLLMPGWALLGYDLWQQRTNWPGTLTLPGWGWLGYGLPLGLLAVAWTVAPSLLWAVEGYGYDVTSYHLQLPREWLALGRMVGLEHNVYSFLPGLGEAGYLLTAAAYGGAYANIYLGQTLHGVLALLTALLVRDMVRAQGGSAAVGLLAGAVLLATPWTVVTGSSAYNEWFAMGLGAAALALVLQREPLGWRHAGWAGFLVGGATLAKLTAGPNLAIPVGLLLLLGWARPTRQRWRQGVWLASVAALAGVLTLLPWLTRNAVQTGNPVFPFATTVLGTGHWTPEQAQRWTHAHAPEGDLRSRLQNLDQHWWGNAGYGAVAGRPRERQRGTIETQNVAHFRTEFGIPTLWLALAAALGLLAWRGQHRRRAAAGCILLLTIHLQFWLLGTHLQARFLIWTLLPSAIVLGLAAQTLGEQPWLTARLQRCAHLPSLVLLALLSVVLSVCSYRIFFTQVLSVQGQPLAPWQVVDQLPREQDLATLKLGDVLAGDHVINHFPAPGNGAVAGTNPAPGRTLLVADASRLLYVREPMVYASAFDQSPLGAAFAAAGDDPLAVTVWLREHGMPQVWVNFSELDRLLATYGFDPRVTRARVDALVASGWRVLWEYPPANQRPAGTAPTAALYALPGR